MLIRNKKGGTNPQRDFSFGVPFNLVEAFMLEASSPEARRRSRIRPSPPSADVFLVFRKDETSMVVQNFIKLARRFLSQKRNSGRLVTGR